MKNQHLIPINVIDIVEKMETTRSETEKLYLLQRLEAIKEYCDKVINKFETSKAIGNVKKKK